MKKCVHCGADMPDDAKACSNCGWPAEDLQEQSARNNASEHPESDKTGTDQSGGTGMDQPGKKDMDQSGLSDKKESPESSENKDKDQRDDKPERMPWDVLSEQPVQQAQPVAEEAEHQAEHPKEKFDIPWDPDEADRKKERAKASAESAHVNSGSTDGAAGAGTASQGTNQDTEDSSSQAKGYWFHGQWHPMTDLDSGNDGSSDNGGNAGDTWNSGSSGNNRGGQGAWQNGPVFQNQNENSTWNQRNDNGPYYNWNNPFGNPDGAQGYPPRTNNFAVAAITMAVLSIFLNSLYCIPSVLGIVFAVMALQQMKKNPGQYKGKGMATAALVISIVLFIIYLIVFIEVARLMQDPAFMQQIEKYMRQLQGGSVSSSSSSFSAPTQVASIFRFRR